MKQKDFKILNILPEGKVNAISSEELVLILDLPSKRELQKQIAQERKAGALILSTTKGGYYRSNDRKEISEFVRTVEKRAKNTINALKPARRYLKTVEGQMSMKDIET